MAMAAAIICASLHMGKHESEIARFVKGNLTQLRQIPILFLSVSRSDNWQHFGLERSLAFEMDERGQRKKPPAMSTGYSPVYGQGAMRRTCREYLRRHEERKQKFCYPGHVMSEKPERTDCVPHVRRNSLQSDTLFQFPDSAWIRELAEQCRRPAAL
jgi:hypothetical protein